MDVLFSCPIREILSLNVKQVIAVTNSPYCAREFLDDQVAVHLGWLPCLAAFTKDEGGLVNDWNTFVKLLITSKQVPYKCSINEYTVIHEPS
ncbi:hypothetical protein COJE103337_00165 [Corynebacterium jeikeium]|nr:hypothetical protein BWP03_01790 [Corynebacterium jeikeium]WCZ53460.1 hypothetical protein CJEIK_04715 [Corynebacterium jeikeium]SUY81229.1 Uncharacterised protein [Corynebacterium jeikeium]